MVVAPFNGWSDTSGPKPRAWGSGQAVTASVTSRRLGLNGLAIGVLFTRWSPTELLGTAPWPEASLEPTGGPPKRLRTAHQADGLTLQAAIVRGLTP